MEFTQAPPGFFPHLVLLLWVVVAFAVFAMIPGSRAIFIVMLTGTLFMPERAGFDAPAIPPMGKHELTVMVAFIGTLAFNWRRVQQARLLRGMDWLLLAMLVCSAITVLTNPEKVITGPVVRPGLTNYDVISTMVREFLRVGLVFLLGRMAFASSQDLATFWRLLLKFGLVYAFLMLLEMRLSPQLHRWVFGYHAHSFLQTMRWGGYRPTVFMEHGLAVGVFALAVLMAAVTQARLGKKMFRLPAWAVVLFFAAVFVLCKSTGAIVLALALIPVALLTSPRRQLQVAALLAAICAIYPASKVVGFFPGDDMVEVAIDYINVERAQSMDDRFLNDEILVDRAARKLWFGWGDYGRHRVFDEQTGKDISVTDGYWIIQLGSRGVMGLGIAFTLLLLPAFLALRASRRIPDREQRLMLAGMALIHMVYVFDLLPNGLYNTLPFFFAGGLARLAKELPRQALAAGPPAGR